MRHAIAVYSRTNYFNNQNNKPELISQPRQLAAIMFTDIVGFTAFMRENEEKAVALIKHYNTALNNIVSIHQGKVLNYYGDGSLCTFPSVIAALNCALDLQKDLQSEPNVPLRIGLHIGEVFFEEEKALGDGVNVASRIQSLGLENTILFSREIYDKIKNHPEFESVSLGYFDFMNMDEPIEVFSLINEGLIVPKREQMAGKVKDAHSKKKKTLQRNFTIVASLLIILTAVFFLYTKYFIKENNAVEKSIVIIPFRNMSNDPQQEYFAEGMMDEILNHLYKMGGLNVISRSTSMAYKNSKKSSREIANELGVENLLAGSVQTDGAHIRIIVQLINGKTDQQIWGDTYDREFKDVFYIQSDIAQQIAAALKVKIDPGVKERIENKPTTNTEAYNLYLQSLNYYIPSDPANPFKRSMSLLEAAINLDSTFADAYAELAKYWLFLGGHPGYLGSQEVLKNAEPLLQKALELNPNLASAHLYLSYLHLWYKWDFESVQNEYQKVLRLNPSNPELAGKFQDFLLAMGRFGEALNVATNSFKKDSSTYNRSALAFALYYNNNPVEALQTIKNSEAFIKKDNFLLMNYIRINLYTGEYQKAISSFENYKNLYSSNVYPRVLGYAAIAYYETGRKDSTEKFLNELKAKSEKSPVGSPAFYSAAIYAAMGESEQAIRYLEKAYKDHEVEMFWLKVEPIFKSLHSDPGFIELLNKIGFK